MALSLKEQILSYQDQLRPMQSVLLPSCGRRSRITGSTAHELEYRDGLQSILSKTMSNTGSPLYSVKWNDGHISKVKPGKLRNYYELVESFEYDQFQNDEADTARKPRTRQSRRIRQASILDYGNKDTHHIQKKAPRSSKIHRGKKNNRPRRGRQGLRQTTTTRSVSYLEDISADDSNDSIDQHASDSSSLASSSPSKENDRRRRQPMRQSKARKSTFAFLDISPSTDDDSDSTPVSKKAKRDAPTGLRKIKRPNTIHMVATTSNLKKEHSGLCCICTGKGRLLDRGGVKVNLLDKHILLPCRYCSNSTHPACCKRDENLVIVANDKETYNPVAPSSRSPLPVAALPSDSPAPVTESTESPDAVPESVGSPAPVPESTESTTSPPTAVKVDAVVPPSQYHICQMCFRNQKKLGQPPGACDICDRLLVSIEADEDAANDTANRDDLLFRCRTCQRAFCNDCTPLDWHSTDPKEPRLPQQCTTCTRFDGKNVDQILTWRHVDASREPTTTPLPIVDMDDLKVAIDTNAQQPDDTIDKKTFNTTKTPKSCVFLVKWMDVSYRHLDWVPGSWLVGVSAKSRPFMENNEDHVALPLNHVVPKSYKTIDRILDVEQTSSGKIISVFAKFYGLPYDESCWDTPPFETDSLAPYQEALRQYRMIESIEPPTKMNERIVNLRSALVPKEFGRLRELKSQPSYISNGQLLPHQLDGLNWLLYQWELKQACILADDMGLGKTIQVVTFLDFLLNQYNLYPFLLVVPNSTATNWLREFRKWAPDMVVVPYFGSKLSRNLAAEHEIFRNGRGHNKISCHVVVTTYESALSDVGLFSKLDVWPYLVVDEAQRLKNNASLLFKKLADIKTDNRILLTGTPLQNDIGELISIMNFIDPSTFDDVKKISTYYSDLNHNTMDELHQQLKPYFLRRTKEIVLKNLPPKKEIIVPLSMTRLQKELYKDTLMKGTKLVAQLQKQARGDSESTGKKVKQSYNNVIMILRKILNHPYLLPGVEVPYDDVAQTRQAMVDACGKLKLLNIMLPKLFSQGHRVLIFSTMAIALDVLEDYMTDANINFVRLDGSTRQVDRVERIDAFNAPNSDVKVFLLTTRAGGVGINLATSDTVIIYDSDFNPHCDLQAISRAHRFGQQNPVLVLRFITRLTVEERIVEKSKKKMVLDHLVVDKINEKEMNSEDVESIIKFGLTALFDEDSAPKDIVYDSAAVDELLDRETIFSSDEPDELEADTSTENKYGAATMSFSFAKIWQRLKPQSDDASSTNSGVFSDQENNGHDDQDKDVWEKLLSENQRQLEKEALLATENLGRGARKRKAISYTESKLKNVELNKEISRRDSIGDKNDPDFKAEDEEDEEDEDEGGNKGGVNGVPSKVPEQQTFPITTTLPPMQLPPSASASPEIMSQRLTFGGQHRFSQYNAIPQPHHQRHIPPTPNYTPQTPGKPFDQQPHLPSDEGRPPTRPVPYDYPNIQQGQPHHIHDNGRNMPVNGYEPTSQQALPPMSAAQTAPPTLTQRQDTPCGPTIQQNNPNHQQAHPVWPSGHQQQHNYQYQHFRSLQRSYLVHEFPHFNEQQLTQVLQDDPWRYRDQIYRQQAQQIEQGSKGYQPQQYHTQEQQAHQHQIREQQAHQQIRGQQAHQHQIQEQQPHPYQIQGLQVYRLQTPEQQQQQQQHGRFIHYNG